jgi:DNA-binding LacI/PurR family transcriptional regulator
MSTISAVAKLAGVSRTTVSHVINHAHRVSGPVRDRVLVAIDHLDYVPNRQAQSLRTGRTNVVAMLIPDIANPFYPELVKVAQIELERAGLDTLIFNTDVPGGHSQEHGRQYLRQISGKRVDGLIVADFALHGIHDLLVGLDIPTVFIGHLPNHAVDSVKLDDFGGGYQLGEYLARKGHRRVAHVTGPSFFQEAMARARGFEEGFLSRGGHLGSDLRFEGSYLPASGRDAARWLVETHGHDLPSAIFFGNFLMASGAIAEFYDLGLRVPQDLKMAVFDDLPMLEFIRPRLTRVGSSPSALAQRAAAMLLERLNGGLEGPAREEVLSCCVQAFDTAS